VDGGGKVDCCHPTEGLFVRQRLSSEPDRYRGRRRVQTPPRSRYAVVGAAAFLSAGAVAYAAASQLPDAKAVNPSVLANMGAVSDAQDALAERSADTDRASRSNERTTESAKVTEAQIEQEAWMLPLEDYEYTSPYGMRLGRFHAGIDLAAPEGTPYKAIHAGTVTQASYNGGYGNSITVKHDDGSEIVYAHSRRLLVKVGDKVNAGQVIGQVGNTGASYGTHLHVEVHVSGSPVEPIAFLRQHGVDIKLKIESVYGGSVA
jgi:murein DD-endopeptidase MepM/ murein hydrolase activator NlpD